MPTERECVERERIRGNVALTPEGCWQWLGASNAKGYGFTRFRGKQWRAHRAAYTAFVGPIPDGLTLDHLCRNPGCVNPDHLDPVTIRENIYRGAGEAVKNRAKRHCCRGHPLSGDNLRTYEQDGRPVWACRTCQRASDRRRSKEDAARRQCEYRARKRAANANR